MTGQLLVKLHYLRAADRYPLPGHREPVTMGLPCPRGELFEPLNMAIDEGEGRRRPVQCRVLDRWSDGSVRWVLLDWLASSAQDSADLVLEPGEAAEDGRDELELSLEAEPMSRLAVSTGAVTIEFSTEHDSVFEVAGLAAPTLIAKRADGENLVQVGKRIEVEERGPVRSTVLTQWDYQGRNGEPVARVQARCHCFAGLESVKLEVTLHNPRAAGHPGGIWTLGAEGGLNLAEVSLTLPLSEGSRVNRVWCSTELGEDPREFDLPFSLFQASSGGENWNSRNQMDADGAVTLAHRGFVISGAAASGMRATPLVALETATGSIGCAMQYFWQNSPKSIDVTPERLELGLWPRQHGAAHEIQGGERKTHSLVLAIGPPGGGADTALDWGRSPLTVRASPDWYSQAEAVPFVVPAAEDPHDGYKRLVEKSLDDSVGFVAKRETVDEYGWRHFGDLYGDHESAFHDGPELFLSHYNNQYDAIAGFATQFFRHGERDWYLLMDELARHVVDIDLYHTTEDKSTYNGGQFWHTIHYIDAGTSTHRAYPPADGVNGGGPSTGNLYAHGLLLHYYLTGSRLSLEAVESLGRYVIEADDGRRTIFRFLDRGHTGHVSESGFDAYHGPGRSPANAISASLDAYRLTQESRFLDKAEQLIRRCIHPEDDIAARGLDDAEHRWFYTMFLQTLGKYLLLKSERHQFDSMYHYARESLLAYAEWATENERPYLDHPERLEIPTETWAAQDLRKCEMLNVASLFADRPAAARMRERARYFFDYAVGYLQAAETSTYCRPLVLLLSNGASQAYFDGAIEPIQSPERPPDLEFGKPERFETQKTRALRRAKALLAVGGVLVLSALALLLMKL